MESVEKTRLLLESQTEEVRNAVEEKLKTAAEHRDENIKKILKRLKEHVSYHPTSVIISDLIKGSGFQFENLRSQ